jgi:hypothetical protein
VAIGRSAATDASRLHPSNNPSFALPPNSRATPSATARSETRSQPSTSRTPPVLWTSRRRAPPPPDCRSGRAVVDVAAELAPAFPFERDPAPGYWWVLEALGVASSPQNDGAASGTWVPAGSATLLARFSPANPTISRIGVG